MPAHDPGRTETPQPSQGGYGLQPEQIRRNDIKGVDAGLLPGDATSAPLRSLEGYLADLVARFDALPLTSPARGPIAERIRAVEAEIDARMPL